MVQTPKPLRKMLSRKKISFVGPLVGKQRTLGYSNQMKQWVQQNRGLLVPAFFLLRKNFAKIQHGATVTDPKRKKLILFDLTG